MKRHEEQQISQGIHQLASTGKSFNFLVDEEDFYTLADLKQENNG